MESRQSWLAGFIVKEACRTPSNWRSRQSLQEYLASQDIVGIQGIDTRALTTHLRNHGSQQGCISHLDPNADRTVQKARQAPSIIGRDLVREVTCSTAYPWTEDSGVWGANASSCRGKSERRFKVVAFDFGIKYNILRRLVDEGCDVTVVPAATTADAALALNPDGIFLSNGPGDPEAVPYAVEAIEKLLGRRPIFGICLGHQLMGLAFGGRTYKLPFGHHGGNQPVKDLTTGRVEITAQNHGFAVDADSLPPDCEVTHINLNDNTVEGLRHRSLPVYSVQYHPEAGPGPHDPSYLFDKFVEMMEQNRKHKVEL